MDCSITQISPYGFQDNSHQTILSILPPPTISGHLPASQSLLREVCLCLAHFLLWPTTPASCIGLVTVFYKLLFICLFPLLVYLLLERGIIVIFKPLMHSIVTPSLTKTLSFHELLITLYDDLLSLFCHLRFTSHGDLQALTLYVSLDMKFRTSPKDPRSIWPAMSFSWFAQSVLNICCVHSIPLQVPIQYLGTLPCPLL